MDTKEWLGLYPALYSEREHLYDRKEDLERNPQGGVSAELQHIEHRIKEVTATMDQIWAAVCSLDEPREMLVLEVRYLEPDGDKPMKWKDVARRIFRNDAAKNVRAAQRRHNRAIEHIQMPMEF